MIILHIAAQQRIALSLVYASLLAYTLVPKKKQDRSMTGDIEKLSFEDALSELEGIVKKMESGDTKLEDSISAYERGTALKNHCEKKLREAQSKIEKISIQADGSVKAAPFEEE